ncbi:MAG: hypothetical protein WC889_20410 [Myxococcota bacterium]|jgi:hypothetical protein
MSRLKLHELTDHEIKARYEILRRDLEGRVSRATAGVGTLEVEVKSLKTELWDLLQVMADRGLQTCRA